MRRTLRISLLALALTMPAYAGEMQGGIVQPPPPSVAEGQAMDGDMHYPLTEITLNLLRSVLALF